MLGSTRIDGVEETSSGGDHIEQLSINFSDFWEYFVPYFFFLKKMCMRQAIKKPVILAMTLRDWEMFFCPLCILHQP